jgi:hypothetical protein
MRSNAEMANIQGCRLVLRTSLHLQLALWLGLAWLGLAWLIVFLFFLKYLMIAEYVIGS